MRGVTCSRDQMDAALPKCTIFQRLQVIEAHKGFLFAMDHAKRLVDCFDGLALVRTDAAERTCE
ncbi:MAG: hypothetical protein QOD40_1224 [Alphaproteobacteria bacterium]|nr:hypothetical protein [Alphaproteobacteria bacterium]